LLAGSLSVAARCALARTICFAQGADLVQLLAAIQTHRYSCIVVTPSPSELPPSSLAPLQRLSMVPPTLVRSSPSSWTTLAAPSDGSLAWFLDGRLESSLVDWSSVDPALPPVSVIPCGVLPFGPAYAGLLLFTTRDSSLVRASTVAHLYTSAASARRLSLNPGRAQMKSEGNKEQKLEELRRMTSPLLHVPDCYLRDAESGEPISVDDFLRRAEQSCSTSPRTFANASVQTHVSDLVTFLKVSDVQHEATKLVSPLIKPKVETAEFSCQTDDPVTLVVNGHDDLVVEPVAVSSDPTPTVNADISIGVQTSPPTGLTPDADTRRRLRLYLPLPKNPFSIRPRPLRHAR
ncbi:hypothetical protein HDU96_003450, partial [Phlyctochytrium bullatum]